jgi:hypothetical protein
VVQAKHGNKPVFTDDSGNRALVSRVVVRGLCGLLGLCVVAVVLSAALHITLPGLDHPLALPGAKRPATPAPRMTKDVQRSLPTTDPTIAAETAGTIDPAIGPVTSSPVLPGVAAAAPTPVVARATVMPYPASSSARPRPASPPSRPAAASRSPSASSVSPTPHPRATRTAPVPPSATPQGPAPVSPSPASGNARVAVPAP